MELYKYKLMYAYKDDDLEFPFTIGGTVFNNIEDIHKEFNRLGFTFCCSCSENLEGKGDKLGRKYCWQCGDYYYT